MWFLVGATFCQVVFSGGHILEMGPPPEIGRKPGPNNYSYDKFNVAKSCLDSWFYQV